MIFTRITSIVSLTFCILCSIASISHAVSPEDKITEVIEGKAVAIGVNGPVVQIDYIIEPFEIAPGLDDRIYSIRQLEIIRLSTGKVIQKIDVDGELFTYQHPVHLIDINFDGYKDLLLLFSAGATNTAYKGLLFYPDWGVFDNEWIYLWNPTFDEKTQQVIELSCGGCSCGDYTKTYYQVYDGAMLLIKQERQEICGLDNKYYSLTELVDGDMVETVREDLSEEN